MTLDVLVVGRQGQLATELAAAAARPGLRLTALGRPELDLTDPRSIEQAFERAQPGAVINAAAYTAVDKAESEPDLAFAINRDGARHLARLSAAAGVPFVHVSTDQVFDGGRTGGHVESDAANPLCVYGSSKLAGEEAVAEANPKALIARVSWVFGPSGHNFVTRLLDWARSRDRISVVCDQRGRPTYSPALAGALIDLAQRMAAAEGTVGEKKPRGLLHLAGASVMTRREQALAVMEASAARGGPSAAVEPILTRDFPTPARRPLNAELDPGLALERYGIRFRSFATDLEETLDRLLGPRI